MVPSSLCQNPRSSAFYSNTAIKSPGPARRSSSCALRHTLVAPAFLAEKRLQRRLATSAQPDDKRAPVADEKPAPVAGKAEPIAPFKAMEVTETNWEEEVLKSSVPVLVDFWAPWCGPCRMIGPTIDEVIEELGDKFKAVKLNTDVSSSIATEYGIRSIPTCMMFKDGKKVDTIIGAVKKPALKGVIEKCLP